MYIVLEFQTSNGKTSFIEPKVKGDVNTAYQAFYTACAAAAVSSVEMHTVMLVHASGSVVEKREFIHGGED